MNSQTKKMKKLTLILVFLFASILTIAQDFNKVYKSSFSQYRNDHWEVVDKFTQYPDNMYITLNGNDIRINNKGESHFKTYGDVKIDYYDTHTCYSWDCLDKEGYSCLFLIKKFTETGNMIMSFAYFKENMLFEYVIDKNN
jgi:hypothetical protein